MDFCDVPLPTIVADLVRPPFMKEVLNHAEVMAYDCAHQTLLNAVFMARLDHVLMEEKAGRLSLWGEFGSLFLYLEMLEQIGQTQGGGKYCKVVE